MKYSKMQKFLCIILALGMMISLGACGAGNKDAAAQNSTQTSVAAESTAAAEPTAVDQYGKYEPGITLTSVKATLAGWTYPEGEDISNNIFTKEFEKELGIKVNYDWIVDAAQYYNKLNLSITSGDIPDFFLTNTSKTFIDLAKAGKLADLTEIFDEYASPEMKESFASVPEQIDSAIIDGRLMAVPCTAGLITTPQVAWIRDDWMQKSGLSAPKTMDELITMAKTFQSMNPNSYGLAVIKDLDVGIDIASIIGFANGYHAYPSIWIKDASGQIAFGSIQPEMKTVLLALQKLYKEGVLSKEFGIKDANKVNEDMVSGKVGIEFGANWNCYFPFPDAVKKDPNAIWKPYPIPSADEKPVMGQSQWPVYRYFVVSKDCKYPEAVIKMANHFMRFYPTLDPAKTNNLDAQNAPVFYGDPRSDEDNYLKIAPAIDKKDPSQLSPSQKITYDVAMKWVDSKDPNSYGTYYQLSSEGSFAILKKFVDEDRIVLTALHGPEPDIYGEKKGTLQKLELDAFTKIIMGESIEKFDEFVANWKKLGGDESTKEINDLYNK